MREFWKAMYFSTDSGYSAARRIRRRLAAADAAPGSSHAARAAAPVTPLAPRRRFAFSR